MKLTLNVLENHRRDADRHWPSYIFGGRIRTSTLVLIIAFFLTWWTYTTYRPHPPPPVVPQVVPETEHQKRRFEDAGRRREMRAGESQRKKEMRASLGAGWHV